MGSNLETVARAVAEKVLQRSGIAQEFWSKEQRRRHVNQCWREYADLIADGYLDEDGRVLRELPDQLIDAGDR